ncbi:hypothetical protein LINPERHAP2_LOCUS10020 [Linum perenne]
MSDSSNSYSSSDEVELEDNDNYKKQKKAVAYYVSGDEYCIKCKCCEKLEGRVPEPIDVTKYLTPAEIREAEDEDTRVRMAHYWKKLRESGGFDVDCPPFVGSGRAGNIYHKAHFLESTHNKTMLNDSIDFGIQQYNKETGKQMKLLEIDKVTVSPAGSHMIFFVTFIGSVIETNVTIEISDPVDKGTTSNVSIESSEPVEKGTTSNKDLYEAVVSYDVVCETCNVYVFRRQSDGEDMFKPRDNFYAELTRHPIRKACSGTIPDAVTEGLEK